MKNSAHLPRGTRARAGTGTGIVLAATAAIVLTGCAPSTVDEEPASSAASSGFPVTVQNCGREVTIDSRPERIVGFEGGAETLFALDAADQVAGYFGSAPEDLPDDLAASADETEHLGSSFPFPTAEQVLENEPDLVVAYSFGDDGALAEQLDAQGIPYLLLSEACADDPDTTVEGYLGDVETIATALGAAEAGTTLVDQWVAELPERTAVSEDAPSVVVYGNTDPSQPFVSGAGSFVQDQLDYAGARNAYADVSDGYVSPSWEDIASRDPDIIFSGGGGGEEVRAGIEDYLTANAALAGMTAVQNDQIITIDYAKNVPGPQAIAGIQEIAAAVQAISG